MATNPVLQAVLLHQHHQTTTPWAPAPAPAMSQMPLKVARKESPVKEKQAEPEQQDDEENGENGQEEEDDNGSQEHQ